MTCFDNYITISESVAESRSGVYATDLPGIDLEMLNNIARDASEDNEDIWPIIYKRATRNLVQDVSRLLQDKFYLDHKLITRETSEFQSGANTNSGLAGVTLEFKIPKYARVHIISVSVYSSSGYSAADVVSIYDTDENGELLATINSAVAAGRNTINVDTDFEVDKLYISYNPSNYSFRKTENKYYANTSTYFDSVMCDQCYYGDPDFRGSVVQVNGGGLNVKYIVMCSIEKFVCENIRFFLDALLYKIGVEITVERRLGERLNRYTVMIQERWDELHNFYKAQYEMNLGNAINSIKIPEDEICFACKNTVYIDTVIP